MLGLIGFGRAVPGLLEMLGPISGETKLVAAGTVDAKSHLRGLNAMMAAIGQIVVYVAVDAACALTFLA